MYTVCALILSFVLGVLFGFAYRMAGSSEDGRTTYSGVARFRRAISLMGLIVA